MPEPSEKRRAGTAPRAEDLSVVPVPAHRAEAVQDELVPGQRVDLPRYRGHAVQGLLADEVPVTDDEERVEGQLRWLDGAPAMGPELESGAITHQPEGPSPRVDRGGQHLLFVVLPRQQCVRPQRHLGQKITSRAKEQVGP